MQPDHVSPPPAADTLFAEETAARQDGSAVPKETPSEMPPQHAGTTSLAQAGADQQTPINRVIDVPLTVTLRFGQRQLMLRELLELNTGSLVELDQQVDEPVHLMLGERIIARGEVVIVDGNYGMRVLEVVEHSAARLAAMDRA